MHVASGERLLHLAAPCLAGPLPHADQGIVCDVGGGLDMLHDVLQRDIPLRPGKLPVWRRDAKSASAWLPNCMVCAGQV